MKLSPLARSVFTRLSNIIPKGAPFNGMLAHPHVQRGIPRRREEGLVTSLKLSRQRDEHLIGENCLAKNFPPPFVRFQRIAITCSRFFCEWRRWGGEKRKEKERNVVRNRASSKEDVAGRRGTMGGEMGE